MQLVFPKDIFDTPCDSVELELIECNSRSDALLANLQTKSDGQLLVSSAMFKLSAYCKGEPVSLKSRKRYAAFVPGLNFDEDNPLYVFEGDRDPHTGAMNWAEESAQPVRLGGGGGGGRRERCAKPGFWYRLVHWRAMREYRACRDRRVRIVRGVKVSRAINNLLGNNEKKYTRTSLDRLGWINYDIFYELPKEQTTEQIIVAKEIEMDEYSDVSIVLRDIRSVLSATSVGDGRVGFGPLKRGDEAYAVGFKLDGDQLYAAIQPLTIGDEAVELDLQPVTSKKSLKKMLRQLD